ncbi:hypothetical protein DRN97_09425 [Methanosarcinales archaeon]|nr:MAG: hypothetical protein DRN97_09425 [Methanosarcinales archaeon]
MKGKRKKHPDTLKARVALEAIKGIKTLSELSAQYKVHPNVISKWKKQLIEGAAEIFSGSNGKGASEEELTAPLYEEIGRLKMENDWLKKKL